MVNPGPAVTALLQSWQDGDRAALDLIVEQLYAQLRAVAGRHLGVERAGHTLDATALVHEAYLRMKGAPMAAVSDRKHFLAIASRVMRCILVDYARRRQRLKRDGGQQITLKEFAAVASSGHDMLEINSALDRLAAVDGRKVRVLELISFAGATYEEAAQILEISEATLHRDLKFARAWLKNELKGSPA
jgi:RNA polymerase sigma factor (TIGR02999 family)